MNINFEKYRKDDIEKKLQKANFRPIDIMVAGVTGAGKSSTLNSLFHREVARVGNGVAPETMKLGNYMLNDAFRIWDTPGLGDGIDRDQIHKKKIANLLCRSYRHGDQICGFIDMVLVIVEGINRDMGTTYSLLNEVIAPNIQGERILVVINQADVAMKGRHWNRETMSPDPELMEFLERQAYSIQRRVKEATGVSIPKPVYYSAEYGYNVKAVLDFIIDNIPIKKRIFI